MLLYTAGGWNCIELVKRRQPLQCVKLQLICAPSLPVCRPTALQRLPRCWAICGWPRSTSACCVCTSRAQVCGYGSWLAQLAVATFFFAMCPADELINAPTSPTLSLLLSLPACTSFCVLQCSTSSLRCRAAVLPYLQAHDAYNVDECLAQCLQHGVQVTPRGAGNS